jgi:hypothetical protein
METDVMSKICVLPIQRRYSFGKVAYFLYSAELPILLTSSFVKVAVLPIQRRSSFTKVAYFSYSADLVSEKLHASHTAQN